MPRPAPKSVRLVLYAGLMSASLAACVSVAPQKAAQLADVPQGWSVDPAQTAAQAAAQTAIDKATDLTRWWEGFGDPALDALIAEALAANPDLATARARLVEARAQVRSTGAGLGPTLDAGASANQSRGQNGGLGHSNTSSSAGLDAAWELDLFGQTQAQLDASRESARATLADLQDTQVSLTAELALAYFDWRSGAERLAIARDNVRDQREIMQIVEWRHQAGLASSLDLAQARTDLASAEAGLPALETTLTTARNRVAILVNRAPGSLDRLADLADGAAPLPILDTAIATTIPATVLERRPDVRAAAHRLEAQVATLNAAKRERFPSIRLSGSIGLQAMGLSALTGGGSAIASLLGSITAPIFQSGRIAASIEAEDARLDQALYGYRANVLTALEDVENALVNLNNSQIRLDRLTQALVSGREAAALAEQRYESGLIDFLAVLDAHRTLRNLEDQTAASRASIASAQVQLFKALGGGYGPSDPSYQAGQTDE